MPDRADLPPEAFSLLLQEAVTRLVHDEPLASFCDWFSASMTEQAQQVAPLPVGEQGDARRYQRTVARTLWSSMPVPSHRWRARSLPKVERNDPCHCGSGRKFKQCCAQFGAVDMPMDSEQLYTMALTEASPDMLIPDKLRQVPGMALGLAAMSWNERGQYSLTATVLQPLVMQRSDLDERYELAFDCLVDALLEIGAEAARMMVVERASQFPNKVLATTARCRKVSMLADQGDLQAAWELFRATQRFSPADQQLWHLELTLLLAEGREQEAQLRAPILAAQARRAGHPDLAQILIDMAQKGMAGIYEAMDQDAMDEDDEQWLELCAQTPETVDVQACRALYQITPVQSGKVGAPPTLEIRAGKELTALHRRWSRQFEVAKPSMTYLQGDVDYLVDNLAAAQAFLAAHPQTWHSMEVLDDLLLAAADYCDFDAPQPVLKASRRLADHALTVLRALLGEAPAQLNWADTPSRALLRPLAQAIEISRYQSDDAGTFKLLQWSLALNPHDNHAWRAVLVPMHLEQSRPDDALQLLDQYPDDMPPSEHLRALALFMQGKVGQAAKVVAATHARYPKFVQSLLPEALDRPADPPGPGIAVGGDIAAWDHRMAMRPLWLRSGALAWLRGLNLPTPEPAKRPKPLKPLKPTEPVKVTLATRGKVPDSFTATQQKHLRKNYAPYVQLHGLMAAIGWAPDLVMPNQWLPLVMGMRNIAPQDLPPAGALKTMNQDMGALSSLVNAFSYQILKNPGSGQKPLADLAALLADQGDGAVFSWAAGFVQGSELVAGAWRKTGRPVSSKGGAFGGLYTLAAQAQADPKAAAEGASAWRARQDTDQPLLVGMQADAPNPIQTLMLALEDLWRVSAPLRQARAGSGPW